MKHQERLRDRPYDALATDCYGTVPISALPVFSVSSVFRLCEKSSMGMGGKMGERTKYSQNGSMFTNRAIGDCRCSDPQ